MNEKEKENIYRECLLFTPGVRRLLNIVDSCPNIRLTTKGGKLCIRIIK